MVAMSGRQAVWCGAVASIGRLWTMNLEAAVRVRLVPVIAVVGVLACGGEEGNSVPAPIPAPVLTSVKVSLSASSIQSGTTTQATVTGLDQRGHAMTVIAPSWVSSNPTVATVSTAGVVTGARTGHATITAVSGGLSATTTVAVTPGVAAQLVLSRPGGSAVNGRAIANPPVVEVRDVGGNLAAAESVAPVTISVSAGTELQGTLTRQSVGGVVVFTGLSLRGTVGSTATLTFRSGTLPSISQTIAIVPFSFGNGTHLVGGDVPAGRYRSANAAGASCYWARLKNLSGRDDIIANDIGGGPRLMEILPTDVAIESTGCAPWTELTGAITASPTAPFTDGVFLVGVDIQPGTWRSDGTGSGCYWARLRNLRGEDDLISNYFGNAPAFVTIAPTDVALIVSRCGSWVRL